MLKLKRRLDKPEVVVERSIPVPGNDYKSVLRGEGVYIKLEEQFVTTDDLSNEALMLFTHYFPDQVERFIQK